MQTFLPYRNFKVTACSLDSRRLNKQRVECKQIINALRKGHGGWFHHPAVQMWRGHEQSLIDYALTICAECNKRGIADNVNIQGWFQEQRNLFPRDTTIPGWLGDRAFHRSHQSNLKRKDPVHYADMPAPAGLRYVWPVPKPPASP